MSHEEGGDKPRECWCGWPKQACDHFYPTMRTTDSVAEYRCAVKSLFASRSSVVANEGETPRTDAECGHGVSTVVNASFARQLERECDELDRASQTMARELAALRSARVEQDYRSHWLMRHADGKEWETSCEYTLAEISGVEWKAKPVRRIEKPSSDIAPSSAR